MNTKTRLINRAAVRDFTIASLAENRPALVGKLTRISGTWFEKIEGCLRNAIDARVRDLPTLGKTIR